MKANEARTERRITWFGAAGTVTIGPGFIHKAGLGTFLIPHPPVINWLLRRGLPEEAQYELSFSHEFGHLQTFPLNLLYMGAILTVALLKNHMGVLEIILVLISSHSAWEMMAEIYAIRSDPRKYHEYYERISIIPRIIFWTSTGLIVVVGWIIGIY